MENQIYGKNFKERSRHPRAAPQFCKGSAFYVKVIAKSIHHSALHDSGHVGKGGRA